MRRKTARKIEPHLAALRRYARSVSASGDAMADRVAQAVRGRDYRDLPPREVRTHLFRALHDAFGAGKPDRQTRSQIDRHGLLLRHAQGFSIQEVAAILRCDVLDLQARLDEAYTGLHAQTAMDVLVIESDPVLAQGLTDIIESLGHRVLGVARDEDEALSAAASIQLDAVVADISDSKPMDRLLGGTDTPIVIVTPDIHAGDDRRRGRPAYAVATPFQVAEFKVTLSEALRSGA